MIMYDELCYFLLAWFYDLFMIWVRFLKPGKFYRVYILVHLEIKDNVEVK